MSSFRQEESLAPGVWKGDQGIRNGWLFSITDQRTSLILAGIVEDHDIAGCQVEFELKPLGHFRCYLSGNVLGEI